MPAAPLTHFPPAPRRGLRHVLGRGDQRPASWSCGRFRARSGTAFRRMISAG